MFSAKQIPPVFPSFAPYLNVSFRKAMEEKAFCRLVWRSWNENWNSSIGAAYLSYVNCFYSTMHFNHAKNQLWVSKINASTETILDAMGTSDMKGHHSVNKCLTWNFAQSILVQSPLYSQIGFIHYKSWPANQHVVYLFWWRFTFRSRKIFSLVKVTDLKDCAALEE